MATFKTHYYCVWCGEYVLHEDAIIKDVKIAPRCPKCNRQLRTKSRHRNRRVDTIRERDRLRV